MMAKATHHHLEYIEPELLGSAHRVKCSCGDSAEVTSVDHGAQWHVEHVDRKSKRKSKKEPCAPAA